MKFDKKIVLDFYSDMFKDEYHRYKSWEHCYKEFKKFNDHERLTLNLTVYLASWGMYRGSCGLLQKDYKIHSECVNILSTKENQSLRCSENKEIEKTDIEKILKLKGNLRNYYEVISYTRGKEDKKISPTDTLISKILLGTLGCTPAYDRYYVQGLKDEKINATKFDYDSLMNILSFINENESEIKKCQFKIHEKSQTHYPFMKIVDMYFWQIGYTNSLNSLTQTSNAI